MGGGAIMITLPLQMEARWKWLAVDADGTACLFRRKPKWLVGIGIWGGECLELDFATPSRTRRVLYKRLAEGWSKEQQYDKDGELK